MGTLYSLLQAAGAPPTVEQLRRAFRALPDLTDADAAPLAKDAYGILVGGLSFEAASTLQATLEEQGVQTQVVEERSLPALPPPHRLTRAA